MARHNALHHDKTLSSHRTEASYARSSKRWVGTGKSARVASRRYNRACRKAAKLQLRNYGKPGAETEEAEAAPLEENWSPLPDDARFIAYCEEYDEVMQQEQ